eukprot:7359367-Pyramimonas_sp.AAC.1
MDGGENVVPDVHDVLEKIKTFSDMVRPRASAREGCEVRKGNTEFRRSKRFTRVTAFHLPCRIAVGCDA